MTAKYGARGETMFRLPKASRSRMKVVAAMGGYKTMLEWLEAMITYGEKGSHPSENQIILTFPDKKTADYVRLVCRRRGMALEAYIIDNFEWDETLPCLVDSDEEHEPSKEICEGCDQAISGHCPDSKAVS